jgi:hypothetical protein
MQNKRKPNISHFLDEEGKIKQLPAPNRTKLPVLEYLASKLEEGIIYKEKEVNELINQWHSFSDYFLLRRLLVDYKFIERTPDGAKYWVVSKDKNEEGETIG